MAGLEPGGLSIALAGSGVFVSLLPTLAEVRRASTDSTTARDVHLGVVMASAALVGAGVVMAVVEWSTAPILVTVAMSALMAGIYEVTLHTESECAAADPPATSADVGQWGRWGR